MQQQSLTGDNKISELSVYEVVLEPLALIRAVIAAFLWEWRESGPLPRIPLSSWKETNWFYASSLQTYLCQRDRNGETFGDICPSCNQGRHRWHHRDFQLTIPSDFEQKLKDSFELSQLPWWCNEWMWTWDRQQWDNDPNWMLGNTPAWPLATDVTKDKATFLISNII